MGKIWVAIEAIMRLILIKMFRLNISDSNWENLCQFVKFGIVGISNTLISYFVYIILITFKFHYLIASIGGFIISVINAFFWNNKYVFKPEDGEKRTLLGPFFKTFTSYAGTGLILNNILLVLWINIFNMHEMIGPIVNLFITIPLNFLLNKYWTFKETK